MVYVSAVLRSRITLSVFQLHLFVPRFRASSDHIILCFGPKLSYFIFPGCPSSCINISYESFQIFSHFPTLQFSTFFSSISTWVDSMTLQNLEKITQLGLHN